MGENWATEQFNRDVVTSSLLKYLQKRYEKKEKPDLVVVTGDIAKSGKREEYRVAEVFFNGLLDSLSLPRERLYLVPGNHDVDRKHVPNAHIKTIYRFEDQDTVSDILVDPGTFALLTKKFEEFNSFAAQAMGRRLYDKKLYRYTDTLRIDMGGREVPINLAGLNSCLFAGYNGDDQQKLAFSLRQVHDAVNQQDEAARLSIAMFHHPFESFHPCDEVAQKKLRDKFDLLLCGHLHDPKKSIMPDETNRAPMIGAGACYEKRESRNNFNEIIINLANGEGRVGFHRYFPDDDCWNREGTLYPQNTNGEYLFTLHRLVKKKLTEEPKEQKPDEATLLAPPERTQKETDVTFIHDYLRPEQFTGRSEERKRLGEIIKTRIDPATKKNVSLASVIAVGGMGKSCLMREVVEESGKSGEFSRLIWFSFYEARLETEGYFFNETLRALGGLPGQEENTTLDAAGVSRLREELCRLLDRGSPPSSSWTDWR